MELDFSALDRIASRGFKTEEEIKAKDALIEKGFQLTEDKADYVFTNADGAKGAEGIGETVKAAAKLARSIAPDPEPETEEPEANRYTDKWNADTFSEDVQRAYKKAEALGIVSDFHLLIGQDSGKIEISYSSAMPLKEVHEKLKELKAEAEEELYQEAIKAFDRILAGEEA